MLLRFCGETKVEMIKELIKKGELKEGNPIITECRDILIDDYHKISLLNKEEKDKTSIELEISKYFADELGFEVP